MVYSYLFPFCYLQHLDSLRLGHAKWLLSWVRLYAFVVQLILLQIIFNIYILSVIYITPEPSDLFSPKETVRTIQK